MKRFITVLLLIITLLTAIGCGSATNESKNGYPVFNTYRDVPGITQDEIDAIETLKETRSTILYGQMLETEAFLLQDGTVAGFAAKFCELLTNLFEIEFDLQLYDWEDLISGIDNRTIDFTGDLTPTAERMLHYLMTYPIAERSLRIFTTGEDNRIMTEKDINGLKIGSLAGTIDIDHVKYYYPDLVFSVVEAGSFEEAAVMLESGDIDAFVTEGVIDPLFDKYGFINSKEFFRMVYTPVSLTTTNSDLKPIIDVVNKYIAAGGIDTLYSFYVEGNREYARYKLAKSFDGNEKKYLTDLAEQNGKVKILLEQDNYPVSFYNRTEKEFQGVAVDVLSEISNLTGLEFEIANNETTSWPEIHDMLQTGEASIVSQLLYSEERKNIFLWSDVPYASGYYALLSRTDYPNLASYQVVRATVGVIEKSAYEDNYHEWFPENDNVIIYDDQDVLLDALENGEIDLVMGSDYILLMQQNYREKSAYKVNLRFGTPMYSYFGFNKNEAVLCSITNKAQSYVDTARITDDWTSRGYDYDKKIAQQRTRYILDVTAAICVALILMIILLIKNRRVNVRLDKSVREITADINATVSKLKAVISNYSGVIWSVDRDNTITLFDGLHLKEIGVTPDFLEGKKLDVARTKNRHLDIIESVGKTFTEGPQDWIAEIDGKMFHSHTTPIYDENGGVISVVGSTDDLTELIQLQQELEAALRKAEVAVKAQEIAQLTVSSMFEANPQINLLFSDDFTLIDCNPAAYKFLGLDSKEALMEGFNQRIINIIPEYQSSGRVSATLSDKLMIAAKEGYVKFETEIFMGGAMRNVNVECRKILYKGSNAIVAYIYDMTEIHERELELIRRDEQLLEAVEEAKAANRAKSDFLSTMSHEIRTPMNAILGITEIQLQNESIDQSIREALDKIYISGDMLLGIINDILDLSKIEAGKLELIIDNYETASLISDTAQLNMMRIGSKPIEFEVQVDENIPFNVVGDELRVKQILNNILSNAFKYTAEGAVTFTISAEKSSDGKQVILIFSVTDTGQGMTEEQIGKLFDEYSRFNMNANRTTEGTGLGMSIAQKLISLMHGKITVESEPGKGSIFTVFIPQDTVDSATLGKELAANLHQFRTSSRAQMKRTQVTREYMPYGKVLIVDDVETNIYVAKGLLTPYGLQIDSADSGFAAIDKIKGGLEYDIIFMDHMMPKMDGIEAAKIIRDMGYERSIVALTANAVSGQVDVFLNNGFDDYISKPIDVRQLNVVLNKLIRDKQPPEVIEAARRHEDTNLNNGQSADQKTQQSVDPGLAEIFLRDARKSLAVLDEIMGKQGVYSEDEVRSYVIHVHGMKSALANIGNADLSAVARDLEQHGRDSDIDVITEETPSFLQTLRAFIDEITPVEENTDDGAVEEDKEYLHEKLLLIKSACEDFDESAIEDIITGLKQKTWTRPTKDLLKQISEHLLHSDFDEISEIVTNFSG